MVFTIRLMRLADLLHLETDSGAPAPSSPDTIG
jgi:hypothetical protein